MVKKTFRVENMHCTNCATKIESIEDDLPGIREVSASYVKQQMVIEYDENLISDTQIVAAVKKKGYLAVAAQ
jgi:copper chaperone CopZ